MTHSEEERPLSASRHTFIGVASNLSTEKMNLLGTVIRGSSAAKSLFATKDKDSGSHRRLPIIAKKVRRGYGQERIGMMRAFTSREVVAGQPFSKSRHCLFPTRKDIIRLSVQDATNEEEGNNGSLHHFDVTTPNGQHSRKRKIVFLERNLIYCRMYKSRKGPRSS